MAALQLTCHAIKSTINHTLSAHKQAGIQLFSTLNQFLIDHFFPGQAAAVSARGEAAPLLPLVSDSLEAAQTKEQFCKMADLTLGVAQACLHQCWLCEVLKYMWRQWDFAPAKLDALCQQLLSPHVTVASSSSSSSREGAEAQAPPLLKVEYMQREDDYLAQFYALGIRACLSLGLPDMPQERVEIGLCVLQSGDPGDLDCLNLRVFVDLRTSSATWKQCLQPSTDDRQQQEEDGDKEAGEAEGPLHVVLFDYCGLAAILLGGFHKPTMAMFTVLRKLWQCVGLNSDEGNEGQTWKGMEVLTTLLACLGFAWKDDVEMLWAEHCAMAVGKKGTYTYTMQLPKTGWLKHKERQEMAPYIAQLNAFLGNWQQCMSTERLSCFVSYIRQRIQGGGAWPPSDDFTLECVDGYEVAKQLRAVYARTLVLPSLGTEYSSTYSESTVELAFPISADALRRAELAGHIDDDEPLPVEVIIRVSTKGNQLGQQAMVTARVVGHHLQLFAALASLAAKAQPPAPLQDEEEEEEEEEGVIVLRLKRDLDVSRKRIMAMEAIKFVGCLLGLSLRDRTPPATPPGDADSGHHQDSARELTPFAQAVLLFLDEAARVATWDAKEGAFRIPSVIRQDWDDDCDDEEYTGANGNTKLEKLEAALTRVIEVLCHDYDDERRRSFCPWFLTNAFACGQYFCS